LNGVFYTDVNSFNFVGGGANQMDNLAIISTGSAFVITEINYAPGGDMVALT